MAELNPPDLRGRKNLLRLAVLTTAVSLVPTFYVAYISNSSVLYADLLRCTAEFLSILVSWIVLLKISKLDRSDFNYGFGKLEQIASLMVGLAMLLNFLIALGISIARFIDPQPLQQAFWGMILAALSVLGNLYMWSSNRSLARVSQSSLVESQARLFRAKTVSSAVVLGALVLAQASDIAWLRHYSDPLGSLIIALFLLSSAHEVLSHAIYDLVDRALEEAMQVLVLKALVQHERLYAGFSGVVSRRVGKVSHIDIQLEFTPQTTMDQIQHTGTAISAEIRSMLSAAEVRIIPKVFKAGEESKSVFDHADTVDAECDFLL